MIVGLGTGLAPVPNPTTSIYNAPTGSLARFEKQKKFILL
jgi:hypothetical protein